MERKRGQIVAVVIALVVAVVSLGVAFAAFSTTLTIGGTATVQATTWDVFFASASNGNKPSSASALPTANVSKTGTGANVSNSLSASAFQWTATLKTPGDSVTYTFYARNAGDYNAKVRETLAPTLTCTYADESSAAAFCTAHVKYGIYKNSGCTTAVTANDPLNAGGYAQYWVKVELLNNFNENGSDLPTQNVTVTAPAISVIYDQNGSAQ